MSETSGATSRIYPGYALLNELGIDQDNALGLTHANPDDEILIAGTLVEGIGTPLSDIDIYVISDKRQPLGSVRTRHHYINANEPDYQSLPTTSGPRGGDLHETFDYLDGSQVACNVEYWTFDEVASLVEESRASYRNTLTHTANLEPSLYFRGLLLHRLFNCIRPQPTERFSAMMHSLDKDEVCYVGYRSFTMGYDQFRDIIGAWRAGYMDSGLLSLTTHLTDQMLALSFLVGMTNPSRKWIFKKVKLFPPELAGLTQDYLAFMECGASTDDDKTAKILAGCDLLDRIFTAGQAYLEGNAKFMSCARSLELTRAEYAYRLENSNGPNEELRLHYLFREKMFRRDAPSCRSLLGERATSFSTR